MKADVIFFSRVDALINVRSSNYPEPFFCKHHRNRLSEKREKQKTKRQSGNHKPVAITGGGREGGRDVSVCIFTNYFPLSSSSVPKKEMRGEEPRRGEKSPRRDMPIVDWVACEKREGLGSDK